MSINENILVGLVFTCIRDIILERLSEVDDWIRFGGAAGDKADEKT